MRLPVPCRGVGVLLLSLGLSAGALGAGLEAGDGRGLFAMLSADALGLRWDGVVIGMTRQSLDALVRPTPGTEEQQTNLCDGYTVRRMLHGRAVDFELSQDKQGRITVAGIFVPFTGAEAAWSAASLVAALKRAVSGLVYLPSRHAPDQGEADNAMPMFQLAARPGQLVFIKPGEGIYIGFSHCLA